MIPEDKPRICYGCWIEHIENCPDCFGFGLTSVTSSPIPAGLAEGIFRKSNLFKLWETLVGRIEWKQCITCGGTPYGVKGIKHE